MSDNILPPQSSPSDTSNWDNKVFTTPVVKSVDKIIKNIERRQIILNAPERERQKQPKNTDVVPSKNR